MQKGCDDMDEYRFAHLSENQEQRVKQLEDELGVILIAYEENRNQDKLKQTSDYYQDIFCE